MTTILESPRALAEWLEQWYADPTITSFAADKRVCGFKFPQLAQHLRDYQALVDALRTARQCPMSQPKE